VSTNDYKSKREEGLSWCERLRLRVRSLFCGHEWDVFHFRRSDDPHILVAGWWCWRCGERIERRILMSDEELRRMAESEESDQEMMS
jgi:hypothetical protein